MYDSFATCGPNGSHKCLVTEVVMLLSTMFDQVNVYPTMAKTMINASPRTSKVLLCIPLHNITLQIRPRGVR